MLETYGCGYADDVDVRNYKLRDKQSHRLSAIQSLADIQKMFEIAIKQMDDQERGTVISLDRYSRVSSRVLKNQLKNLFEFQRGQFKKLEEIMVLNY